MTSTSTSSRLCELCKDAGKAIRPVLDQQEVDESRPWIFFNPNDYSITQDIKNELCQANPSGNFKFHQGVYWTKSVDRSPPCNFLILEAEMGNPGGTLTPSNQGIPRGLYLPFTLN